MGFSDYRTALVTGASSGIGAATVRRLSAEGLEVYAVARDAARLNALSTETGCRPCAVDISDLDALAALAKSTEFDVLVNNAGQSRRGNILDTTPEDVDALIDVNLRAVLHLTRLVIAGHGAPRPRPCRQHLLHRRPLRIWRWKHRVSCHESGHSLAVAAIAR